MKRDLNLFIRDILESINAIEEFSKNINKKELISNRLKQSAIIREIEIIGEAAKNIPNSFREKYPNIQWHEIAGMRDVIIHGYFRVDLDAVWNVIKKDLPILKKQMQKIKKDMQ
jgi:uncharacterized protein with HEPN domain